MLSSGTAPERWLHAAPETAHGTVTRMVLSSESVRATGSQSGGPGYLLQMQNLDLTWSS